VYDAEDDLGRIHEYLNPLGSDSSDDSSAAFAVDDPDVTCYDLVDEILLDNADLGPGQYSDLHSGSADSALDDTDSGNYASDRHVGLDQSDGDGVYSAAGSDVVGSEADDLAFEDRDTITEDTNFNE
jgi:hypothetical protein